MNGCRRMASCHGSGILMPSVLRFGDDPIRYVEQLIHEQNWREEE